MTNDQLSDKRSRGRASWHARNGKEEDGGRGHKKYNVHGVGREAEGFEWALLYCPGYQVNSSLFQSFKCHPHGMVPTFLSSDLNPRLYTHLDVQGVSQLYHAPS